MSKEIPGELKGKSPTSKEDWRRNDKVQAIVKEKKNDLRPDAYLHKYLVYLTVLVLLNNKFVF